MATSFLPSIIPDTKLQLEYNYAKIKADPFNYTLTDRVLFYDRDTCFFKYNIFNKSNNTEWAICSLLGLDVCEYLYANYAKVNTFSNYNAFEDFEHKVFKGLGYCGELIKYNNLIINEISLIDDINAKYETPRPRNSVGREIYDKGYLKALEMLFTKAISKSSLIPNLFYLATNFKGRSLEDLENITFAKEAIKDKKAPLVLSTNNSFSDTIVDKTTILSSIVVPSLEMYKDFVSEKDLGNDVYRAGLTYAIIYGVEILYYFSKIEDEDIKIALEDLFSITFKSKSFCEEYLYSINDLGHLEINDKVKACFADDNTVRFSNIWAYYDSVSSKLNTDILSDFPYFKMPIIFAKMIQSMHAYAFQICRVKHVILLYQEAKSQGVLTKDTFQHVIEDSSSSGGLFGGADEEPLNELLNLDSLIISDAEKSIEDFIESEKSVEDMVKEKAPTLNTMDALNKDLYSSMYDFDIKYVQNDVSNKEAYYKIAKNITMVTHNLAKQIKEIRTYNTGGKQSGLLTGKLDRKNLHRYKSDPKIFYNNNYKIKEMDLAFGCILDESGSMHGDKIKNGRIVMIMLHEVLTSLGINHGIIGHSGNAMYQSTIYKYYQFKEEPYYSLEKPYNLVTAQARSCNCDSGALYYMQNVMKRVQNKDKIVIIFSDGQPTECTDLDLTNQVKAMEKDGIHVIGVGINFDAIKDYYPDNANGRNLKEMVDIVISILKRYVLEKKED